MRLNCRLYGFTPTAVAMNEVHTDAVRGRAASVRQIYPTDTRKQTRAHVNRQVSTQAHVHREIFISQGS